MAIAAITLAKTGETPLTPLLTTHSLEKMERLYYICCWDSLLKFCRQCGKWSYSLCHIQALGLVAGCKVTSSVIIFQINIITFVIFINILNYNNMKDDVLQRIKSIIDGKFSSESQFAKAIGVNQNTLNQQLRGKRALSTDVIISILTSFEDLSSEWLMRGEGSMFKEPSQQIGDITSSTVVGNNVHGSGNNISCNAELAALQQQYLDMLKKQDEQIDRLMAVIEKLTAKL